MAAAFAIRRLFRIYPLTVVRVLLVAVFGVPRFPGEAYAWVGWPAYLSNLAITQNLTHSRVVLAPLWTLPLEPLAHRICDEVASDKRQPVDVHDHAVGQPQSINAGVGSHRNRLRETFRPGINPESRMSSDRPKRFGVVSEQSPTFSWNYFFTINGASEGQ